MKRLCVVLVMVFLWFSAGVANAATALLVGGAGQYATLTDEPDGLAFSGYFADTRDKPVGDGPVNADDQANDAGAGDTNTGTESNDSA